MKASPFDYVAARTVAEAAAALASSGLTTAAIAGGQSLVPMLNLRVAQPDLVVGLGTIDELRETAETAGAVRIGALTTHAALEDGLFSGAFNGFLQRVASKISYRAVRHHGTIGGSLALADPAADWPGCLLALGATVRIAGVKGSRSELVQEFVRGQYETSLASDEVILGFEVPRPSGPFRWGCHRVMRKSGAFASSIAFAVTGGGPATVVLAAAASKPYLLPKVAEALRASPGSEDLLRAAIIDDIAPLVPKDDGYLIRLHTATVLRAVREMLGR